MNFFAALVERVLTAITWVAMHVVIQSERWRRRLPRRIRKLSGSVRRSWRRWVEALGVTPGAPPVRCRRRKWNRTPAHVEEQVVRLHVEHPHLGIGALGRLAVRVIGFKAVRETFRRILIRRHDLIVELDQQRRKRPRRIHVSRPRALWGADLTIVWLLGIFPVWLVGIVDYHGSRLVALERVRWPTTAAITSVMTRAFEREGVPDRLLTDRDPLFRAGAFKVFVATHGVTHTLTKPAHPWTNGRIERLFRTFKETVSRFVWLLRSTTEIDAYCADFVRFYNTARPHGGFDGLTPDEVKAGRQVPGRAIGRATYFDGQLRWCEFAA
jgi:putative transposase